MQRESARDDWLCEPEALRTMAHAKRAPSHWRRCSFGKHLAILPAFFGKPRRAPIVNDLDHRHRVRPFQREVRALAMRVAAHAPGLPRVIPQPGALDLAVHGELRAMIRAEFASRRGARGKGQVRREGGRGSSQRQQ